jgi:hypothetical protein
MNRLSKQTVTIIGIIPLVLLAIGGAYYVFTSNRATTRDKAKAGLSTIYDKPAGVSFSYDSQVFTSEKLTEADTNDRFVARLTSYSPPLLLTVKYETGLSSLAALSSTSVTSLLRNNVLRSLPKRYPEYKLINSSDIKINEMPGYEVVFEYTGPSGKRAKQKLTYLINNSDKAVYFSLSATIDDFTDTAVQQLQRVIESLQWD